MSGCQTATFSRGLAIGRPRCGSPGTGSPARVGSVRVSRGSGASAGRSSHDLPRLRLRVPATLRQRAAENVLRAVRHHPAPPSAGRRVTPWLSPPTSADRRHPSSAHAPRGAVLRAVHVAAVARCRRCLQGMWPRSRPGIRPRPQRDALNLDVAVTRCAHGFLRGSRLCVVKTCSEWDGRLGNVQATGTPERAERRRLSTNAKRAMYRRRAEPVWVCLVPPRGNQLPLCMRVG